MFLPLTVCALHLSVVSCLYEADVAHVQDACDDLQHLNLDFSWDPNHLHGFLERSSTKQQFALLFPVTVLLLFHCGYTMHYMIKNDGLSLVCNAFICRTLPSVCVF